MCIWINESIIIIINHDLTKNKNLNLIITKKTRVPDIINQIVASNCGENVYLNFSFKRDFQWIFTHIHPVLLIYKIVLDKRDKMRKCINKWLWYFHKNLKYQRYYIYKQRKKKLNYNKNTRNIVNHFMK